MAQLFVTGLSYVYPAYPPSPAGREEVDPRSETVASQQDVECVLDRASRSETVSTCYGSEPAPMHQLPPAAGEVQPAPLPEGEAEEEAARRAQASEAIRNLYALRDSLLVPPEEDTETDESVGSWLTSSDGGESGADDESEGDDFSGVHAAETSPARVEPDRWDACCTALARLLRDRPTLPADASEPGRSMVDVETPWRLPLYSCPFKQCTFHTDERQQFLEHLGTSTGASPHYAQIRAHCEPCLGVAEPLDCVYRAIALLEQDRIPCIGPATTRRALRTVTTYYNDEDQGDRLLRLRADPQHDGGPERDRSGNGSRGGTAKSHRVER